MGARLRRVWFPLRLVARRLRNRLGRAALLGLGIAGGAAILATVIGGSLVAEDETVGLALARVQPAERSVAVTYADLGLVRNGLSLADVDPLAEGTVGRLSGGTPARAVQFKLLTLAGTPLNLAGMDGVGRGVRLRSGRLPRTCSPERCEVVLLGGSEPVPSAPGLRFDVVGRGSLRSAVPFGLLPGAAGARVGESFGPAQQAPFVLAEGFDELAGLPALGSLYRTYVWVAPLPPGRVRPWQVDKFAREVVRARSTLRSRSLFLDLSAPVEELSAAAEAGRVSSRRLLVVGGEAAALVLAFALLAAAGLRRDVESAWQRLTWTGARRWQLALLATAETGVVAFAGGLVGWLAGAGATAVLASRAGTPVWAALGHSVLGGRGIAAAAALVAAATAVLVLALRAPAVSLRGRAIGALDVAGLGALGALALILSLGRADPASLADGDTGTLLLLLPGLVVLVAAVACTRLLVPVLRVAERAARKAPLSLRLPAVALARSPGHAVLAVTFLAVSLALALFAAVYRATLSTGLGEQARYAVPADLVVREDLSPSGLVAPLEAAPLADFRGLGVEAALPVIRLRGSVGAAGGPDQVTLLAVPAGELGRVGGWRPDFSAQPLDELARRLDTGVDGLRGAALPADAEALVLPASVRGGDVGLTAVILTPRGTFARVKLGETSGGRRVLFRATLPPGAAGGRVVSFGLERALSAEGHGDFARVDGVLRLGPPLADTPAGRRPLLAGYQGWEGADNVRAEPLADGARLRFLLSNESADSRFAARQATAARPLPVVASPGVAGAAGAGGVLPLRLPGGVLQVRVVATAARFPSTRGEFLLADERSAFVAANDSRPGSVVPNEVWLDAARGSEPTLAARLARPPYDRLAVDSQARLEQRLRGDPLARGALLVLTVAAVAAALLALAGLLLLVATDARDERGELRDLEVEGMPPAALRTHLRVRAALVAALGIAGGLAVATVLSLVVVDLVAVTANAAPPDPPLALDVPWALAAAAAGAFVALAALIVSAATRRPV